MARFKYVAMNSQGQETEGVVDAESQAQAVSMIRSGGLFPTKVIDISGGGGKKGGGKKQAMAGGEKKSGLMNLEIKGLNKLFGGKVKSKQIGVITRQLATLIAAGLPLLRGLKILLKQEKAPPLREALNGMGESVEGGSTFSEALSQYPKLFDNLYVNMIKAGEAGGVLDTVLARLAEFIEKAERIKNKVKSAMIYPIVVLVAAIGISGFLMVNVIPKFEEIFRDLLGEGQLPALTQFVINISGFVQNNWLVVVGIFVVASFLLKMWKKTDTGKYYLDMFKLKAPLIGPLFSKTAVARFSRTLGTLLTSGVPVLQALNIVRDTSGNEVIARAIQSVHNAVKEGDPMAAPLEASGAFPGMLVSMVDVGEETGALPEMLMRIADTYDDEVDTAVEGLTATIEPIMIVMLAVIIGTIVIAMFVPLVTIITSMSG